MSSVETTDKPKNPALSDWLIFIRGLLKYIALYLVLAFWIGGSYMIYLNKVSQLLIIPGDIDLGTKSLDVSFYGNNYKVTNLDYLKDLQTPTENWWGLTISTIIARYFITSAFYQTIWVNSILQSPRKLFSKIPEFLRILLSPLLLILFCIANVGIVMVVAIFNCFYTFFWTKIQLHNKTYTVEPVSLATFIAFPGWDWGYNILVIFFLFVGILPMFITLYIIFGLVYFLYILSMPGITIEDFTRSMLLNYLKEVITNNSGLFYWIFTYGVYINFKKLNNTDGIICLIIMLIVGFITVIKPSMKNGIMSTVSPSKEIAVSAAMYEPPKIVGTAAVYLGKAFNSLTKPKK